jgi:cytochrome P450
MARHVIEDTELRGCPMHAGDKVLLAFPAGNRDPAVFDDPDEFRPDREPNPHLAFGAGVHFCVGAPLARMELVESLGLLLRRLPGLQLVGDPVSRGTFVLRGYSSVTVGC